MRSFVLSAFVLSLLISFVSVSAMIPEDVLHERAPAAHAQTSTTDDRQVISDKLKKYMNGLYDRGRMQGMSGMSCINTVIDAIEKKEEIPVDIRKAHIINWLTEAVEDEKDLRSAYRLYTLTGRQNTIKVWRLAEEQQVDLLALARRSEDPILRGDIAVIFHTHGQDVPNDLLQDFRYVSKLFSVVESCSKAARRFR